VGVRNRAVCVVAAAVLVCSGSTLGALARSGPTFIPHGPCAKVQPGSKPCRSPLPLSGFPINGDGSSSDQLDTTLAVGSLERERARRSVGAAELAAAYGQRANTFLTTYLSRDHLWQQTIYIPFGFRSPEKQIYMFTCHLAKPEKMARQCGP
jgi:hypothetical protein